MRVGFTVGVLNATLDLAALVLVGVVGFLGSEVVLSPVVSHCLRLSPFHVGGGCWLVWPPSWALKWSCLPLSPVVSLHVGGGCWLVWPHLEQKYSEIKITGFNLNLLTVNCLGSTLFWVRQVRAWTKGDESRQNDDAKRERLMQERFASPRQRRVGFGLRDLEL